jgi:CoA:oxalate CoA-transferase
MSPRPEAEPAPRPLDGVRVVDLTRVMSGPYCTAMFADLGAEVIKVEMPGIGDTGRLFGPHIDGESAYFNMLNRGKQSVTVQLKDPAGVEIIRDLIRCSDVLVENFRPGVMARLGLDYPSVRTLRPELIYASITGFGAEGQFAQLPAFDLVIQAMSGLMSITGERDGRPNAVGESLADVCTGMFAAWGIAAALFERERTGKGQHLDVSMLDSVFSMLLTGLGRELHTTRPAERVGNRHPETYPVDSFPTVDGDVVLVCFSDATFATLLTAIGRPELVDDPRFLDNSARNRNEDELRAIITGWTSGRARRDVLESLRIAGIPCAPVWTLRDVIESGHPEARGMVLSGTSTHLGPIRHVPQPVHFRGVPTPPGALSPQLGEHTEEVLRRVLGYDDARLADLKGKNVL